MRVYHCLYSQCIGFNFHQKVHINNGSSVASVSGRQNALLYVCLLFVQRIASAACRHLPLVKALGCSYSVSSSVAHSALVRVHSSCSISTLAARAVHQLLLLTAYTHRQLVQHISSCCSHHVHVDSSYSTLASSSTSTSAARTPS